MLHDKLHSYLEHLENNILILKNAHIEKYEEELLSGNRINLRIRIRFFTGQLLELNEAIIVTDNSLMHLGYRYHFQDNKNKIIFRYDNTPHFPELESFPHHKHTGNSVISSPKPSIFDVLEMVIKIIQE